MSNEISANVARTVTAPADRQAEIRPVEAPAPNGKVTPQGGNDVPRQVAPEIEEDDLERALDNLNQFLADSNRNLQFRVDEGSGRTVITVINASTEEVVRQIPADEVLEMARRLQEQGVQLFSAII